MNENADFEVQRKALLARIESQRQRMGDLLTPGLPMHKRLSPFESNRFPRSITMQLLLEEPLILSGVVALTARLLGPRAVALFRTVGIAFRVSRTLFAHTPAAPAASASYGETGDSAARPS